MSATKIQWTQETWNPTTGCDQVSPGCDRCYAKTMARRLKAMGQSKYQRDGNPETSGPGFGIAEHPDTLNIPLSWRKPRRVFVNSMSDLFHDGVSDQFIARVFATMALTPQHTYQVLTKRHARMRSLLSDGGQRLLEATDARTADVASVLYDATWPLPNVWVGVSAETQKWADIRIPALLKTPAAVRFVSCEPLLGPLDLTRVPSGWPDGAALDALSGLAYRPGQDGADPLLDRIDWVIAGGESGAGARPMMADWARSLRDQCVASGVPYFFKQWGSWGPSPEACAGRLLDGRTWDEFPTGVTV